MPENPLRVAYARGVTPGKWARIWGERFPRVPLELVQLDAVTDASAEAACLYDGSVHLAFVRLPVDQSPALEGLHLIPLYEERPFVVAPKGHLVEAADEVGVADLEGEHRHPFDDDIATTVEVVAANVGVVIVPQSIARLYARKDVVARPVAELPGWRVGLAWPKAPAPDAQTLIDDFIGVVRGRTANSSRGGREQPAAVSDAKRAGAAKKNQPPRSARAGRSRRRPTR